MAVRQRMSRALGVIGLTALAAGCADDGVSLHAVCPIAPELTEGACVYDPGSDVCVGDGVLNVAAASSYRLNLKVESGLKSRMRDVPLLAETNGMQITSAEVELRVPSGGVINLPETKIGDVVYPRLDNPLRVSATGYLDPQGSVVVPVVIFGSEYVRRFAAATNLSQIVAAVTLHGKTNGDEEVESGEFNWPIRLITANPAQVGGECQETSYCASSFGQDSFAQACRDSNASD
ncbi:MAG TPA: hypothetical protein VFX59_17100 [Polyangiales bacterium]|nr:hypothetical protein [Polyangiales bacterium]